MPSDLSLFLRQMVRQPHRVVALAPSSDDLAAAMTEGLSPATGRVIELGAGTGKLTRAILGRGVRPCDLTLYELNPDFALHLRRSFPDARVLTVPAQEMALHEGPGVGAVISGLPLLSMTETAQRAILAGAFRVLRPGGVFVQFTYGPRVPLQRSVGEELSLVAERGPKVWNNLPPARVYTFRRAD